MHFDYIIGNPPYQEKTESDSTRMSPIYNRFIDASYKLADKVELITPARFLFNAGYTPKTWNKKMLSDEHFKVLHYEVSSKEVFPNTDIKGGVAITYHDLTCTFGAIKIFTKFDEMNSILIKVMEDFAGPLSSIIAPALNFKLSDLFKAEHPELIDRLRTNAFSSLSSVFYENMPCDGHEYIRMFGLLKGKRTYRYIRRDYVRESNGSGALGEVLSTPLIGEPLSGEPLIGYTQSFIGIGDFDTRDEAEACLKYVKTKFARAMLGVLKVTQDNPPYKWEYVPMQDFTSSSDIDWNVSISEIDEQLYRKYGLSEDEIRFVESHVKPMD